jgi:hypothetical protein
MPSGEWTATGQLTYVSAARATAAEARADAIIARARDRREHVWIAAVAFLVYPPVEGSAILDAENILGYPGIGCFICEAAYTDGDEHSRCPGDPPGPPFSRYSA